MSSRSDIITATICCPSICLHLISGTNQSVKRINHLFLSLFSIVTVWSILSQFVDPFVLLCVSLPAITNIAAWNSDYYIFDYQFVLTEASFRNFTMKEKLTLAKSKFIKYCIDLFSFYLALPFPNFPTMIFLTSDITMHTSQHYKKKRSILHPGLSSTKTRTTNKIEKRRSLKM
jgi:hypothetical protein